jgi:glycerol-3-phosphate dehydrogenase
VADVRLQQIEKLQEADLDVLVLGGGINGAGVIRDLALRSKQADAPLRIGLVEQHHFASGTSGKNSQLIHGGLRYLKYLQFPLVRESLQERSILLRIAPQFVKPLSFLLPMYGIGSRLKYGAGLWLYDLLAGSHRIARHRVLNQPGVAQMEPELTQAGLTAGAIFYDGAIVSARFVVENILDAMVNGAMAANYVQAAGWERARDNRWSVHCEDALTGERFDIRTRKLVDARGAWSRGEGLRLVRGSHIVIPRVNTGDHAIAHFEPDGRIIFLIPWGSEKQLTLVGTTDVDHQRGPDDVHISSDEQRYLLGIVRKLYPGRAEPAIVSTFSSLRPLVSDRSGSATSASRGHKIWNAADGILHIAGGKYTTYRVMSEQASDLVCAEIAAPLARVHPTAETPFAPADREIGDAMEQHLSDYLFISTYLGYEQRHGVEWLRPLARELGNKRGWSEARVDEEVNAIIEGSSKSGRSAAW